MPLLLFPLSHNHVIDEASLLYWEHLSVDDSATERTLAEIYTIIRVRFCLPVAVNGLSSNHGAVGGREEHYTSGDLTGLTMKSC